MLFGSKLTCLVALATGLAAGSAAALAQEPTGVWIDHTGRGAVEIAECSGGGLCGHVVWVKDAKNKSACRTQIIGNAKPVGSNTWDRGWILDPDDNKRYSVELKPVGADRLRVTGYMGSKIFSETMMWKRAPADLRRCDVTETAVPAAPPVQVPVITPAPAPVVAPARPAETVAPEQAITPFGTPQHRPAAAPATPATPVEPRVAEPAPAPVQSEVTETTAAPKERRPRQQASSKSRECTLDLPYITLKYPCDAF